MRSATCGRCELVVFHQTHQITNSSLLLWRVVAARLAVHLLDPRCVPPCSLNTGAFSHLIETHAQINCLIVSICCHGAHYQDLSNVSHDCPQAQIVNHTQTFTYAHSRSRTRPRSPSLFLTFSPSTFLSLSFSVAISRRLSRSCARSRSFSCSFCLCLSLSLCLCLSTFLSLLLAPWILLSLSFKL